MSLRFRLNLMIALAMLIIVGVGAAFVVHSARRSVAAEVGATVEMALQLADAGLGRGESREQALAWLAKLAELEKIRHLRIQLSQPAQSLIRLSRQETADRQSRAPAWFAWAVTPAVTRGEKQLAAADGAPIHITVEADPADEIAEAWGEARSFLLFMLALAAAVAGLVHISLGRAFKAVGHILQGLAGIEQGEYGRRLPRFGLAEFDRLSAGFNHMAEALARAQGENRALARQSLQALEEERRYLAQEMHDELGQSLSAIKALAASLRGTPGGAAETIMEQCDRLFGVVRGMMRRLRPLMLDELGLSPSLQDMVDNWRARHPGVAVRFDCEEGVDEFAGAAKIHLFRIVQESLTNIAKHARAGAVDIELGLTEDNRLRLAVRDDGAGFDPARPRAGFGLSGMAERVASLEGVWHLRAAPGRGVELEILIPCESIHEED